MTEMSALFCALTRLLHRKTWRYIYQLCILLQCHVNHFDDIQSVSEIQLYFILSYLYVYNIGVLLAGESVDQLGAPILSAVFN